MLITLAYLHKDHWPFHPGPVACTGRGIPAALMLPWMAEYLSITAAMATSILFLGGHIGITKQGIFSPSSANGAIAGLPDSSQLPAGLFPVTRHQGRRLPKTGRATGDDHYFIFQVHWILLYCKANPATGTSSLECLNIRQATGNQQFLDLCGAIRNRADNRLAGQGAPTTNSLVTPLPHGFAPRPGSGYGNFSAVPLAMEHSLSARIPLSTMEIAR